jgi:hypothetical protein
VSHRLNWSLSNSVAWDTESSRKLRPSLPRCLDDQPYRSIRCLIAVFSDAWPGERIFFDNGKIEGVIRVVRKEGGVPRLEVKIYPRRQGRC